MGSNCTYSKSKRRRLGVYYHSGRILLPIWKDCHRKRWRHPRRIRKYKTTLHLHHYWCEEHLVNITLSGTPLVHPDVDYTPHYGIDRNIGIGTTGIQLSGGCDDIIVGYGYNGTGDIRFTPYVTIGGDLDLSKEIKPPSFDQDPTPTWDTEFSVAAATERVTWDPAEGTVLFSATGTANESIIAQTPEDVEVLFRFIGSTIDPDGDPKFTVDLKFLRVARFHSMEI